MITKNEIEKIKKQGNDSIINYLKKISDNGELLFFLKNLGYLPKNLKGDIFLPYLTNPNKDVRLYAIKNLGKISNGEYLSEIQKIASKDSVSMVRREAVSAIGRMRNPKTKGVLIKFLKDDDPKIILQAIRGLLVFKENKNVQNKLLKFKNHENELIKIVIEKEFFDKDKKNSSIKHPESPKYMQNTVVLGDVLKTLNTIPEESIHLTFTSPPYYNARDYSIYKSYDKYLDFLANVFKEVHRITKEGRFFILNTSPIIIPRISRQHSSKRYPIPYDIHPLLVKMGWEFIDDIIWLKPEASVKNRTAGFLQHRKPLAYKPNCVTECLMVYRKKTLKLIDWNIKQYPKKIVDKSKVLGNYDTANIWKIDPTFNKTHSAVFPVELCEKVIKYYSFIGDLVFDPFAGSGTMGIAAKKLERKYFLTELNEEYFNFIKNKLNTNDLFEDKYNPNFLNIEEFKKYKEMNFNEKSSD